MSIVVQIELPEKLAEQTQLFVEQGYALSMQNVVTEALSRYLSSHAPNITEKLIMDEVERGLYGES